VEARGPETKGSTNPIEPNGDVRAKRILLFGATGTIGRATLTELLRQGHHVVCFVRPQAAAKIQRCRARDSCSNWLCHQSTVDPPGCFPRRSVRRGHFLPVLANGYSRRRLENRSSGEQRYPSNRERNREAALHITVGNMRAKTETCISARQTRIRSGAPSVRPTLFDHSAYRFLQVAIRPSGTC
jgi:hypothetical protein